ncbi:hypothetical protein V6Z11_D02G221800 [Gossypium hirsutum]
MAFILYNQSSVTTINSFISFAVLFGRPPFATLIYNISVPKQQLWFPFSKRNPEWTFNVEWKEEKQGIGFR